MEAGVSSLQLGRLLGGGWWVAGMLTWPPGWGRAAGASEGWCQVTGLTAWVRAATIVGEEGRLAGAAPVAAA